jgi:hypothetical protein
MKPMPVGTCLGESFYKDFANPPQTPEPLAVAGVKDAASTGPTDSTVSSSGISLRVLYGFCMGFVAAI